MRNMLSFLDRDRHVFRSFFGHSGCTCLLCRLGKTGFPRCGFQQANTSPSPPWQRVLFRRETPRVVADLHRVIGDLHVRKGEEARAFLWQLGTRNVWCGHGHLLWLGSSWEEHPGSKAGNTNEDLQWKRPEKHFQFDSIWSQPNSVSIWSGSLGTVDQKMGPSPVRRP